MVNVASNYAGHLMAWSGEVVARLSDGTEIRAGSEDMTLTELGLLIIRPDGRRTFVPSGSLVELYEAEAGGLGE